jgi:preprotein translocase subunit SecE
MSRIVNFLKEVRTELTKVSWSTKDELVGASLVVIVTTAMLAVFIGVIDIFLSKFLNLLVR